ncbi:MAG: hypothetical protein H6605_10055 [Flavobacteriales bacterium]|nr:hypothetical protein [Flavobacteriales bacterium]
MNKVWFKDWFYLTLISLASLIALSYFAWISPGCEGGMDSYNHYLISRFSWKHPYLLLDQWGKPIYNILASPFASIGFFGVELFNILLWLGSAWMVWLTAKKLELKYAWLGFILVLLPQESVLNTLSGLTEYLNEFLLILFMYLAASRKWNFAAGLAGMLPFARSEGFVIMLAVGFYLVFIEKKYKSLLWFLAGPVIFNILGWIILNDPQWILHNPYIKAQLLDLNICGSGSLFHYVNGSRFIFSLAGSVLLLAGTLWALFSVVKISKNGSFLHRYMFWLCAGIFWLYFGVHSFIWWKGMMGSCGYSRVMIVIVPLMALLSVYGAHRSAEKLSKYTLYLKTLLLVLIGVSFSHTYQAVRYRIPLEISREQAEFVKVADWVKTQDFSKNKLFFLYPYLSMLTDTDPYDKERFEFLWSFDFDYSPPGSILIWDGHFGPNECQIPLDKLMNNPDFELLRSFIPEEPFKTLNDYSFEIHVFKRIKLKGKN